ncbi:MAG: hypothetical protein ACE5FA_00040 [Dehalococcoidia bacterium]
MLLKRIDGLAEKMIRRAEFPHVRENIFDVQDQATAKALLEQCPTQWARLDGPDTPPEKPPARGAGTLSTANNPELTRSGEPDPREDLPQEALALSAVAGEAADLTDNALDTGEEVGIGENVSVVVASGDLAGADDGDDDDED